MRIVQFMHPGHEYNPHVRMNIGETRTWDWNIGPARRYVTTDEQYRCRCPLDFAALNTCVQPNVSFNERVQAVSYFDVPGRTNVFQVWREIARQVIDNGFVLGTSFAWPQQH